MITSLSLAKHATFGLDPVALSGLTKTNFIFGDNGSGKTTISRLIANPSNSDFFACKINWDAKKPLREDAYNKDFVEQNFRQDKELPGVFTLGRETIKTKIRICELEEEIKGLDNKIGRLRGTVEGSDGEGGKRRDLGDLDEKFKDLCWKEKMRFDEDFGYAFKGLRNSSKKFFDHVLSQHKSNTAQVASLEQMKERAETLFDDQQIQWEVIDRFSASALLGYEGRPILAKSISGRDDTSIASLVKILGNSDWVRGGLEFHKTLGNTCPFCQQPTPEDLQRELEEFFDDSYMQALKEIESIIEGYQAAWTALESHLKRLLERELPTLDGDSFVAGCHELTAAANKNLEILRAKGREPSRSQSLTTLQGQLDLLNGMVTEANKKAAAHNQLMANLDKERKTLTSQVWKHIIAVELSPALSYYLEKQERMKKAISCIEEQLNELEGRKQNVRLELQRLERSGTSVVPTIDAMNKMLSTFGFSGFSFRQGNTGSSYKIVREDGKDAKATLSEGEMTFVTFLYFIHSIAGSPSSTDLSVERIVVFDDPVSSLDSGVLFVVSSLIRDIIAKVEMGEGNIKQVFVLTHNIYFHKEVTFSAKGRKGLNMKNATYWILGKPKGNSQIRKYEKNPIRTSYELLWLSAREPHANPHTIQNTYRRILENYFMVLGGYNQDEVINKFRGQERSVCAALFSWINAGSHDSGEDLYTAIDEHAISLFADVFERIFTAMDHKNHYEMMMNGAAGGST